VARNEHSKLQIFCAANQKCLVHMAWTIIINSMSHVKCDFIKNLYIYVS